MSEAAGAQRIVERIVSDVPAGLPAGTTPPAGATLAFSTPSSRGSASAGFRTLERDHSAPGALPMTIDTAHDLASVTKIVGTTASLIRLVSARLLSLDDAVDRFIPAFRGREKKVVTVRDLLLHRGGLWEWHPVYLQVSGREAALRFVSELPLRYPPKAERHYSDLGFMLLGEVVSAVAGAPLERAVRDLVTGPLGMASTRYTRPIGTDVAASAFGDQVEMTMIDTGIPYPVPYSSSAFHRWRTGTILGEVNDGNAFHALEGIAGHAGLFSTVSDLIAFADALSNYSEHDALWRTDVVEEFFASGPDEGQALGFRRYSFSLAGEQVDLLGHTGFVGCAIGFVPGHGVSIALASNRLLTEGTAVPGERIWRAVISAVGIERGRK